MARHNVSNIAEELMEMTSVAVSLDDGKRERRGFIAVRGVGERADGSLFANLHFTRFGKLNDLGVNLPGVELAGVTTTLAKYCREPVEIVGGRLEREQANGAGSPELGDGWGGQ